MTDGGAAAAHEGGAVRRDVAGRDIDEATAFYADLHNAHRVALTPVGRAFSYRVRAVGDVSMTLRSSALTANRWGRIEPDGQYFLTWAQGGSAAIDAGTDQEQVLTPGVAAMYPTGRAFTLEAPAGVVLHAVDFDATFLEALDAERRRADPRLLCFDTQARPDALDVLQRRLAAAAPELLLTSTDPARRAVLTESIGRLLLDAFVDNDVTTLAPPGRTQMAMQYIVDHCAEPITSADIAAAAGLSQRGLQQAFARAELPPPITALRQARLEAVRTALQHADPTVTTVGEIATAWGFAHLGRFSGYYEAAFGEFPRATLHRSA